MTIQGVQLNEISSPTDNTDPNTSLQTDSSASYPDPSVSATQFGVSRLSGELQLKYQALPSSLLSGNPHAGLLNMHSQAYWFQQNLTVFRDGPHGSDEMVVDKPFALVGSSRLCEIVIPDKTVPPKKYYLHSVPEGVFCFDLTADPGDSRWLKPDQPLWIGGYQIKVQSPEGGALHNELPLPMNQKGSVDPPHPELLFSGGGKDLGVRKVGRRLIAIGRHPACALHLSTRTLSSFHCMLFWDNRDLWFIDLHSTTGAKLDGVRKTSGRLENGSVLRLGRTNITCRFPNELVERISQMDSQHSNQPGFSPLPADHTAAPDQVGQPFVLEQPSTDDSKSEQSSQLQSLSKEQAEKLSIYEQRIEELEKSNTEQLAEFQQELEDRDTRHQLSLNEQENLLTAMAQEIDRGRDQASTRQDKIDELQKELECVHEQLAERQTELDKLSIQESDAVTEQKTDHKSKVKNLTKHLEKLQAKITKLEKKNTDTKKVTDEQIKNLETKLEELVDERQLEQAEAKAALQSWEAERTKLEDNLQQASVDVSDRQQEIAGLRQEIAQLKASQQEADRLVSMASTDRKLEREQLAEQISALKTKNQEVAANSEKDIDSLRTSFNQLQKELSASRDALELAKQKLDDFQQRHQLLIDESSRSQKESKQTISRLSKEIAELNESIESQKLLEQKHTALQQTYDELPKELQSPEQKIHESSTKTTVDLADMLNEIRQIQEDNRQSAVVSQLDLARSVESLKSQIQSIQQQQGEPVSSAPAARTGSAEPDSEIASQPASVPNPDPVSPPDANGNPDSPKQNEDPTKPANKKLEVFAESDARPWDKLYNAPEESTLSRFFRWLNPFKS